MSWKVENGPDGLPIWRGQDTIADPNKRRRQALSFAGIGCVAPVLAAYGVYMLWTLSAAAIVSLTGAEKTRRGWGDWEPFGLEIVWRDAFDISFSVLGVAAAAGVALVLARRVGITNGFFEREWTLIAVEKGCLSYVAGGFTQGLDAAQVGPPHWWVHVDQIARVEIGRTSEWQTLRHYPDGPLYSQGGHDSGVIFSDGSFPLARTEEYQTFLFMADGSRRVIYTVNAAREDAGMLAQSVRAWIESARAEAKKSDAPPAIMAGTERRSVGFDI